MGNWQSGWRVRDQEVVWAVAAHQMLGSIGVIRAAGLTLRRACDSLDADQRAQIIDAIVRHCDTVAVSLGDLVRGLPPQLGDPQIVHDHLDLRD